MKLRVIGIDFGTSNSALGFRDYEKTEDTLTPISDQIIISENDSGVLPTLIIEKNEYIENDLFAFNALRRATSEDGLDVKSNFKMDLFDEVSEESKKEAVRLTEKYFTYFYKMYKNKDNLSEESREGYQFETIITCPVRTQFTQKDILVRAAQKAGFPNVQIEDEAMTVMRYAMGRADYRKLLENEYEGTDFKILIVDMGAGTTDMILYSLKANPAFDRNDMTEIAHWPEVGERKTLGGREFDQLLLDYCQEQGYINKDFIKTPTERRYALLLSKLSKENIISQKLKIGDTVEALGHMTQLAEEAPKSYRKSTNKINRSIVETMSHKFIEEFIHAIKKIIQEGGIKESDLDFLILSGGGSRWYFIKDILLDKPLSTVALHEKLDLAKLKKNPTRIITDDEPQLTNLKGILTPLQSMVLKSISWVEYSMEIRIYGEMPNVPDSKHLLISKKHPMIQKRDKLPKEDNLTIDQSINLLNSERLLYTIDIIAKENDTTKNIFNYQNNCYRNLKTYLGEKFFGVKDTTPNIKMIISYSFSEKRDLNIYVTFSAPTLWSGTQNFTIH
jgi:hypothetical protein